MTKGLVVGKFYPLHKGHSFLINTALANTDEVDVLVCDGERYSLPAELRAGWINREHPAVNARVIPDINKDDDSKAWAKHTTEYLGYAPDVVFSSEDYGDAYAKHMGARHHLVDRQRKKFPIGARKIRADVLSNWDFMAPRVRAKYCLRIAVVGAESTGTTTLAKDLAKHYGAPWAPEFGRLYSEGRVFDQPVEWSSQEFDFIANTQQQLEDQLAGYSHGLLICDTNAFATHLWHERYTGEVSKDLKAYGLAHQPALYILTGDEIPFVQDGLRDGEDIRHGMQQRFREELKLTGVKVVEVNGSPTRRKTQAIKAIDKLMMRKITI